MLNKEDRLKIEMSGIWTNEHIRVLQLLYGPLIGRDALALYELLISLQRMPQKVKNHLLIQKISGQSMEQLENSRVKLEQYLLVRTYFDGAKNAYVYELQLPQDGGQFLRHEVFGRMYYQKMGKQVYEYMKRCFAPDRSQKTDYQEISAHMSAIFFDWDDAKDRSFSEIRPDQPKKQTQFNFDLFLSGLSAMILPVQERTKENLDFIAEKADLYGIDEKEMQRLVGKSIDLKQNRLDKERLTKQVRNSRKEFLKKIEDPYALPPIRFLQEKQNGMAVSHADKNLIEAIRDTYHFQPQVINVLVEYVLKRCNQSLSRSYVEKVASTWVRLGIDTKEKAFQYIKEEETRGIQPKQKKKELPQWFHNQKDEEKEHVDDDALMEEMRKLREQNG